MKEAGFYRHYKTGNLYYAFGEATQAPFATKDASWTELMFRNSEFPGWQAELGVLSDRTYVFRTANPDWVMPGKWIAYCSKDGGYWLRPRAMFFEVLTNGEKRFNSILALPV